MKGYFLRLVMACGFFVALALVSFSSVVSASEWAMTYGGSHGDEARTIQQTSDGGYVVAGWTDEAFGAGGADILVLKLDSDGQLEWQRTYGGAQQDRAYSIQQTSDGGYIVAGESSSFSPDQTLDMWILKLKSNGDIEWEKCYHQNEDYLHEGAYSARQTSDGGYIVVGWMQSEPGGLNDIIAMKLANDGSVVWQKDIGKKPDGSYSYDPHDDVAYSVEQTSDGGYIIAGKTTVPATIWYPVPWIIKLGPTGNIQWNEEFPSKAYHLDTNGKKFSIKQTSDGGYIYVASIYNGHDALVIKLDASGGPEWAKIYQGNNYDEAFDIDQTDDGGYIVVGRSDSFSGTIATELWLLKLSATGDIQWQKQYGDGHHDAMGFAVQQTSDGGYVAAGMSPGDDFWVLKLDSNGSIPDCPLESTTSATSSDFVPSFESNDIETWAGPVYAADSTANIESPGISTTEQCLYQPAQYSLYVSIDPEEGGMVTGPGITCPEDCSESYEEGAEVTLTAAPSEGFNFTGWSGDCEACEGANCTITMDGNKTCTANFEPVSNEPPVIDSFTAEPTSGTAPLDVTFTCTAHDPDGEIVSYAWDFDGDGTVDETSDTGTISHTYTSPGIYQATCTVTDNDGDSVTSESFGITVNEAAPSWADITELLNITHSARQLYDRRHRCFFVQITVENPGDALSGPIRMVITDPSIPVKTGVGVGLDPDGYTDAGDPYFTIVPDGESLGAGEVLDRMRVNFNLQRKRLTYGIKVEQLTPGIPQ